MPSPIVAGRLNCTGLLLHIPPSHHTIFWLLCSIPTSDDEIMFLTWPNLATVLLAPLLAPTTFGMPAGDLANQDPVVVRRTLVSNVAKVAVQGGKTAAHNAPAASKSLKKAASTVAKYKPPPMSKQQKIKLQKGATMAGRAACLAGGILGDMQLPGGTEQWGGALSKGCEGVDQLRGLHKELKTSKSAPLAPPPKPAKRKRSVYAREVVMA